MTTSPVINLGQAGLTLSLRIYLQEDGGVPELQGVGAASVVELGNGDYYLTGLPDAPAGSRAQAVIYAPLDAALALSTYEYGAVTAAPAVIWRNEIELPANPQPIKRNDTYGSISLAVLSGLPVEIGNPLTTVTLSLWDRDASVGFALNSPASISDVFLDAATDSYGCTLSCAVLDLTEALAAKTYLGEFEIIFAGALGKTTIPKDDRLEISVFADFNAA